MSKHIAKRVFVVAATATFGSFLYLKVVKS